jgi:3-oxoacyl-(acyl-carrier-protein) synthase
VSGGSEAAITEGGIGGFNAMKALSQRNESPETASTNPISFASEAPTAIIS